MRLQGIGVWALLLAVSVLALAPSPAEALPTCPNSSSVSLTDTGAEIAVCNRHYLALINKGNGELKAVYRRNSDGTVQPQYDIAFDRFIVEFDDTGQSAVSTNLTTTQPARIGPVHDFYARVVTYSATGFLQIERTYEFTRGPHIYEQAVFSVKPGTGHGLNPVVKLRTLAWECQGGNAVTTADDLYIKRPQGTLGGIESVWGLKFRTEFRSIGSVSGAALKLRTLVMNRRFFGTQTLATLGADTLFLVGHMHAAPTSEYLREDRGVRSTLLTNNNSEKCRHLFFSLL